MAKTPTYLPSRQSRLDRPHFIQPRPANACLSYVHAYFFLIGVRQACPPEKLKNDYKPLILKNNPIFQSFQHTKPMASSSSIPSVLTASNSSANSLVSSGSESVSARGTSGSGGTGKYPSSRTANKCECPNCHEIEKFGTFPPLQFFIFRCKKMKKMKKVLAMNQIVRPFCSSFRPISKRSIKQYLCVSQLSHSLFARFFWRCHFSGGGRRFWKK